MVYSELQTRDLRSIQAVENFTAAVDFTVHFDVAWGEMDAFAHVNNMYYFRYFERSRIDFMAHYDLFGPNLNQGIGPILGDTSARFLVPVTFPDKLYVSTSAIEVHAAGARLQHLVYSCAHGRVVTMGQSHMVLYDHGSLAAAAPDDPRVVAVLDKIRT